MIALQAMRCRVALSLIEGSVSFLVGADQESRSAASVDTAVAGLGRRVRWEVSEVAAAVGVAPSASSVRLQGQLVAELEQLGPMAAGHLALAADLQLDPAARSVEVLVLERKDQLVAAAERPVVPAGPRPGMVVVAHRQ